MADKWMVKPLERHYGGYEIVGPAFRCQFFIVATDIDAVCAKQRMKDACLIATAPDLLDACRKAQVQLQKAADQFAFYADSHASKKTPDGDAKAATNMAWARSLANTDHFVRATIAKAIGASCE